MGGDHQFTAPPHPSIDAVKCVHSLCATASCRACAGACPRGAILLDNETLGIGEVACDGCGLCRPACPEAAITIPGVAFDALLDQDNEVALLACALSGVSDGRGVVPCLHGIAERDIQAIAARNIASVMISRGDCSTCPRATTNTFERTVERVNALSIGKHGCAVTTTAVPASRWQKARAEALRNGNDLNQGRRALFRGLLNKRPAALSLDPVGPDALFRWVPELDAEACTGCDACSRICPHGALTFVSNADETCYNIAPQTCTGCGLCRDVCDVAAVSLIPVARLRQPKVHLTRARCSKCGVPYHNPVTASAAAPGSDHVSGTSNVCRICQRTSHASQLFQVRP